MERVIDFVVFPGALGLDITGPLEVFDTASKIIAQKKMNSSGYRARFVATKKGAVRLSSGLSIVADATFASRSSADILLVPGGNGVEAAISDASFMKYIRKRAQQVKRIVSVCKGAFILAAAGILNGKRATTHWMLSEELQKKFPQIEVDPDAIYIQDENVYTSAGVTAGIDLALSIIEEDYGVPLAVDVARALVLYYRRPGSQSQFSAPLQAQEAAGKIFSDLHSWLILHLAENISVEKMADISAMSARNFARVFKTKTGITPNKYLETLRLDKAREIISAGSEPLDRVAAISGFGREERLRRAFLRRYGLTPSQYKLHFMQQ